MFWVSIIDSLGLECFGFDWALVLMDQDSTPANTNTAQYHKILINTNMDHMSIPKIHVSHVSPPRKTNRTQLKEMSI